VRLIEHAASRQKGVKLKTQGTSFDEYGVAQWLKTLFKYNSVTVFGSIPVSTGQDDI
jgi:hypothetical protein